MPRSLRDVRDAVLGERRFHRGAYARRGAYLPFRELWRIESGCEFRIACYCKLDTNAVLSPVRSRSRSCRAGDNGYTHSVDCYAKLIIITATAASNGMSFLERFNIGKIKISISIALLLAAVLFAAALLPQARSATPPRSFAVSRGDGFREIIDRLYDGGFIRSPMALKVYALLRGRAYVLKAGVYELSSSMSGPRILGELVSGAVREVQVVIPEGSSLYDIDAILASSGVLGEGDLVAYALPRRLEGYLFPDT